MQLKVEHPISASAQRLAARLEGLPRSNSLVVAEQAWTEARDSLAGLGAELAAAYRRTADRGSTQLLGEDLKIEARVEAAKAAELKARRAWHEAREKAGAAAVAFLERHADDATSILSGLIADLEAVTALMAAAVRKAERQGATSLPRPFRSARAVRAHLRHVRVHLR